MVNIMANGKCWLGEPFPGIVFSLSFKQNSGILGYYFGINGERHHNKIQSVYFPMSPLNM